MAHKIDCGCFNFDLNREYIMNFSKRPPQNEYLKYDLYQELLNADECLEEMARASARDRVYLLVMIDDLQIENKALINENIFLKNLIGNKFKED